MRRSELRRSDRSERHDDGQRRSERRGRDRRLRRSRWALATLLVALGAVGAILATTLTAVRGELTAAQADLRRGVDDLLAGESEAALAAFARADDRTVAADIRLDALPVRAVAALPVAGPQLRTTDALVDAVDATAEAAREVAHGIEDLDGGLIAIAPRDGGIPIEPLAALQPRLQRAADLVDGAVVAVDRADDPVLLPPLRDARRTLLAELEPGAATLSAGAALVDVLPTFLGDGRERRYLFGASNPAELRGTGGLIGAYAIMTVRDGRISFDDFTPTSSLPRAVDDPPPAPSDDYQERYGGFAAAGHWSNINMTPDFPTAATAIERLHARVAGERVDGTIVADPFALRFLLEATDPVDVPDVGVVRADDVVDVLTHDGFVSLPDPTDRKAVLGAAAVEVVDAFLHSDAPPQRKGRLLADAVGQGHVLLHAHDPQVQAAFVEAGVAGELVEPDGDFVAVVGNNAAANKVDHFAERTLTYEVDLRSDGTAHGRLDVELTNPAPADGLPRYVIGPNDDRVDAGENVTLLSVYCPADCRLDRFRRDGEPDAIGQQTELGRQVLPTVVRVPSGETRTLRYDWERADGWEPERDGGVYRLTVQGQPTVRETALTVRVTVPDGMAVTSAPDGATVRADEVTWRGVTADLMDAEVAFAPEPDLWDRAWTALAGSAARS